MVESIKLGGGWLIFTIRESFLNSEGFKEKLEEMQKNGLIKFERKISWFKYEGMEGEKSYGVFKTDICHVMAYKVNK